MPSSDVHFDVLSSSPTNASMLPEREDQELKKDQSTTTTEIICNACSNPVIDTYLELANSFYHKEVCTTIEFFSLSALTYFIRLVPAMCWLPKDSTY